ncbi:MAG: hypothetical protein ABIJ05_04630, partial [Patescibacteria group bacterium]
AAYLAKEFYPVFDEYDLCNLANYHLYLKLMIDGKTSDPFSAVTQVPILNDASNKAKIIKLSRKKYGRSRDEISRDILFKPSSSSNSHVQQLPF